METTISVTKTKLIAEEQYIIDPIETFAEQLEKIDIATYFCHNCTLEEMWKMKQKFERDRHKKEIKMKKLQEVAEMSENTEDKE